MKDREMAEMLGECRLKALPGILLCALRSRGTTTTSCGGGKVAESDPSSAGSWRDFIHLYRYRNGNLRCQHAAACESSRCNVHRPVTMKTRPMDPAAGRSDGPARTACC